MFREQSMGPEWTMSAQKRVIDCAGVAALSPLLLGAGGLSAASIVIVEGGNPFFTQNRPGLNMDDFTLYKFQTMPDGTTETPSEGANDSRATVIGKILRKTHFDEIPQLLNVIKGDISLVGPRPLIKEDVELTLDTLSADEQREWLLARSTAKPGLTSSYQLQLHHASYKCVDRRARAFDDIEYARTATRQSDTRIMLESGLTSLKSLVVLPTLNGEEESHRPGYRKGARLLQQVAGDFGVNLTDQDTIYWRVVFGAARALDDVVDRDENADATECIERLKNGLPINGMTTSEAMAFREVTQGLSAARCEVLFNVFAALPVFAAKRKLATKLPDLIAINEQEAVLFADMLEVDCDNSEDIEKRLQFNEWLHGFANVGYLADTATDLKADFEAGAINVLPTRSNYLKLVLYSLPEAIRTLKRTPPASIHNLGMTAIHNMRQRHN